LQLKAWLKNIPKAIDIVRGIIDNVKNLKTSTVKSGLNPILFGMITQSSGTYLVNYQL